MLILTLYVIIKIENKILNEVMKKMVKVLFVCLGNICRSPMAEAIFRDMVEKRRIKRKNSN